MGKKLTFDRTEAGFWKVITQVNQCPLRLASWETTGISGTDPLGCHLEVYQTIFSTGAVANVVSSTLGAQLREIKENKLEQTQNCYFQFCYTMDPAFPPCRYFPLWTKWPRNLILWPQKVQGKNKQQGVKYKMLPSCSCLTPNQASYWVAEGLFSCIDRHYYVCSKLF